jgi:hypothetical protein
MLRTIICARSQTPGTQFAPAHVVVNREGEIVYYSGWTGEYLEVASGLPGRQLVASARRRLRMTCATHCGKRWKAGPW